MIDEQTTPLSPTTEVVDKPQGGFGRFKTSEELVKAYESLEKEFTKRSQRLKELEKTQASAPIDWEKAVDNLIEKYPLSQEYLDDIGKEFSHDQDLINKDNCLELAYLNVLSKAHRTEKDYSGDTEFLLKSARDNQSVRDAIIEEYVCSLNPPTIRVAGRGGEIPIAQPQRPKTVEDAGNIALKILKNKTQ